MTPDISTTDSPHVASTSASLSDRLKSWPLAILPHRLLSRLVRRAARWRLFWWKQALIKLFIRHFDVDMSEARYAVADYPDFNSFFTRELKTGIRPLPGDLQAIVSPVDGRVSEAGRIARGHLLQAKGCEYPLSVLLGGEARHAAPFRDGRFATLYLSPRDYHRVHMPCDGRLVETVYVPGRLYSVAPHTTRAIPGLFTRNERLVCLFDTPAGPMGLVMVGAIFVSCMETVWAGVVNPQMRMQKLVSRYAHPHGPEISLARGAEMGRFNMGSTVILLYPPNSVEWLETLQAGRRLCRGETIGRCSS
ncbi:MAG: archaetidylserine decarboxylase [Gammaproteobacteria bacterium]